VTERKVLLVDDEKEFVEATTVLLESGGYQVVAAYSGKEAREKALAEEPDLVVLDVMMESDTAGFEVARWLRSESATERTPIIMLTAVNQKYPLNFDADEIWLPVDAFLEKPVDPEQLLAEVHSKLPAD